MIRLSVEQIAMLTEVNRAAANISSWCGEMTKKVTSMYDTLSATAFGELLTSDLEEKIRGIKAIENDLDRVEDISGDQTTCSGLRDRINTLTLILFNLLDARHNVYHSFFN